MNILHVVSEETSDVPKQASETLVVADTVSITEVEPENDPPNPVPMVTPPKPKYRSVKFCAVWSLHITFQ